MAENETKNKKEPVEAAPAKKGSSLGAVGLVLPALLAGAASFGGTKFSTAHAAVAGISPAAEHAMSAPGPTLSAEPFLIVVQDVNKKAHAMKVTIAIEFDEKAKEETLKSFTPRIRDGALSYLRGLSYEEALDGGKNDKLRNDLLERIRAVGAASAQRVLITDFVIQ
jgi:flagellar basal body-associated protein FliL